MFSPSIGRHNILLRCLPAQNVFQQSKEELFTITDSFWFNEGLDGFGNRIISGGTTERHSLLEYSCRGIVDSSTYCIPDANPHPMFFLPSRLTQPPSVSPIGGEMSRVETMLLSSVIGLDGSDILRDSLSIAHFVHDYVTYESGKTDMLTTAEDTFRSRRGVCQDFAHLMIALCRQKGMAARYVCGLMEGEGATHAWVEVHDGQCWYAFDPTNDTAIATGYIKIAHGRDALDCPVSRGMYYGVASSTTEVKCEVKNE